MLKKLDSGELSGIVKSFDTQSGVYSVQWSDNTEDLLTEDLVRKLIIDSPDTDISKKKWIPFKSQNVYVKVGKTMHEARIETTVPEKQGHVIVRLDINNRSETVDLKDVTPMF